MTKLTKTIMEAINEATTNSVTESSTQKIQTDTIQTRETNLEPAKFEEATYEVFKKKWNARKLITQPHPYIDHAELFLGLIDNDYNLLIQENIAKQVTTGESEDFIVNDSSVKFNWQLTDDRMDTINNERITNPMAIATHYGSLSDVFKYIFPKNLKGANPCIAINKLQGASRTNVNVTNIRAIWVEDDEKHPKPRTATDSNNPLPLPPSFIVESSSGKYHYYWLTTTDDLGTWQRLQKEVMTKRLGSDPGANGLNRAMRVPGFWHSKTRPFATRIVYILGQNNIPITPTPSKEFLEFSKTHTAKAEYAFDTYLSGQVKRYDWEEIIEAFGKYLPEKPEEFEYNISFFDPIEAMQKVFATEDYHASLHALCMHFANYQQDAEYVEYVVQSLMCRVPENQRDNRWNSRFNDIKRSSIAAVTKKLQELAQETVLNKNEIQQIKKQECSIHDDDWPLDFPDIKGACEPLDMLLEDLASNTNKPIRSFNFASALSFFTLALQNIPIMPVMNERTANGCHLLLAPSTDGKDLSVSMPLKSLTKAIKNGHLTDTDLAARELLQGIEPTGEITSLSAFQKWADSPWRVRGGIWINTECTSQIAKMSDSNLNVSNLSEIVVNIQDGTAIPTVTKASGNKDKDTIAQPLTEAYSLLFATQPASIQKYMTAELLYKGVIGRFDYYITDRKPEETQNQASSLSVDNLRAYQFRPELLDFLAWVLKQCSIQRENCIDGNIRRVAVLYDETDPNPFVKYPKQIEQNGPRRQRHVDWDIACKQNPEWQVEDHQFKTFIDRIAMSTERWATIFSAVQHLWECYQKKIVPFREPIIISDKILDIVCKLGEYQYIVRFSRIWPLIASKKGLDEKHAAVLDAIHKADKTSNKWLKFITQDQRHAYKMLFDKEFFMPLRAIARLIPYDIDIPTKDLIPIVQTLQSIGYVDFIKLKQMDARISSKPLYNVIRLTAEGRV